jgi:mannose/fructose-specific phosphotransferase system component IIA
MSEPLIGVIVAHTEVAAALLAAVQAIAGDDAGLTAVSNRGCDRAALTRELEAAVGGRTAVLFTDMAGGSCAHTAAALARGRDDLRVVTGVNLAMLVDFAFHRDLPVAAAARRAVEIGRTAVGLVER